MKVAKDADALLSYDPNLRLSLWPSEEEAREQIMSIWDEADVIEVSDNELQFLTGSDKIDDETAMLLWRLFDYQHKSCILISQQLKTLNFHGSVQAFHVDTVDTTGAGDSFVGALLCKIVDEQSVLEDEPRLREILGFANACGAITTTKKGAIPTLPTTADALELVNEGK
uniref:Carbohydrate kinase PfkB domain-containing protein n=1 Tax=Salix viminalis TaxID=40686 RepID=A0A6N2KRP5_SALVM